MLLAQPFDPFKEQKKPSFFSIKKFQLISKTKQLLIHLKNRRNSRDTIMLMPQQQTIPQIWYNHPFMSSFGPYPPPLYPQAYPQLPYTICVHINQPPCECHHSYPSSSTATTIYQDDEKEIDDEHVYPYQSRQSSIQRRHSDGNSIKRSLSSDALHHRQLMRSFSINSHYN